MFLEEYTVPLHHDVVNNLYISQEHTSGSSSLRKMFL